MTVQKKGVYMLEVFKIQMMTETKGLTKFVYGENMDQEES